MHFRDCAASGLFPREARNEGKKKYKMTGEVQIIGRVLKEAERSKDGGESMALQFVELRVVLRALRPVEENTGPWFLKFAVGSRSSSPA